MAVDKLVDSTQLDADLTSVANAIRTKGGTSASLAFPSGFVSAVDAIPSGGGNIKSGSYTPSERVPSITFDCGLSDINVMIIIPHNETPLKSGGKTFVCGIYTKSNYYKFFCATSNNAGSALLTPQTGTSTSAFVMDGTNVTVYSYHTGTPSINAGAFETITYDWYAW